MDPTLSFWARREQQAYDQAWGSFQDRCRRIQTALETQLPRGSQVVARVPSRPAWHPGRRPGGATATFEVTAPLERLPRVRVDVDITRPTYRLSRLRRLRVGEKFTGRVDEAVRHVATWLLATEEE